MINNLRGIPYICRNHPKRICKIPKSFSQNRTIYIYNPKRTHAQKRPISFFSIFISKLKGQSIFNSYCKHPSLSPVIKNNIIINQYQMIIFKLADHFSCISSLLRCMKLSFISLVMSIDMPIVEFIHLMSKRRKL